MNSKFIKKYCDENGIYILYDSFFKEYRVARDYSILYISESYENCIEYIVEVIINDKHTNNR